MHPDTNPVPTESLLRTTIGPRAARSLTRRGGNLAEISRLGVSELVATYGLTERAAEKLVAVSEIARRTTHEPLRRGEPFRSSRDIFRHFGPLIGRLEFEQFRVLLLDGKHRIVSEHLISQGTLTTSPVHPRETFREAIRRSAAAIVLVHNHPSGDPSPSADDLEVTRRLADVGSLVGIAVLDHVIIGDGTFVSLADRGLL